MKFPRLIALITVAICTAHIAAAQASDAEITGLILDQSAAPVAGTTVTLINEDSGFTRTATTDGEGRYRFPVLPPGRYSIKTQATGFKPEVVTGIVLNIGTHLDRDISLTVGSVQEAITVSGE